MSVTLVVAIATGIGIAAVVVLLATMFPLGASSEIEARLAALTGTGKSSNKTNTTRLDTSLITRDSEKISSPIDRLVSQYMNLRLLFEQAGVTWSVPNFLAIVVLLGAVGFSLPMLAGLNVGLAPVLAGLMALLPVSWLLMRRKRRLHKFASQLPQALELIARALRAGHSLAAGFNLVAQEMSKPIGVEFARIYEEQNLGKPLDEALEATTCRVPNLDLKFFATAVVLQRKTGGDLAEILDKIGHLVRERFQIWGQVQALTGEGRLSGIVLLVLPLVLFIAVYRLNPDYVNLLFTEEMGRKMLAAGIVMQVLGALVIRKIVNIRV
jgi:tight adherence protein B